MRRRYVMATGALGASAATAASAAIVLNGTGPLLVTIWTAWVTVALALWWSWTGWQARERRLIGQLEEELRSATATLEADLRASLSLEFQRRIAEELAASHRVLKGEIADASTHLEQRVTEAIQGDIDHMIESCDANQLILLEELHRGLTRQGDPG